MHADEAVHAVVLGEMLESGVYRYNPQDSHGPTLYYLSALCLRMSGVRSLAEMEAWHLRLVSALVGTATVAALALWRRELGSGAVLTAGGLSVLAAPLVYYQRYFIHEGLYVLLTLHLLRVAWAWSRAWESVGLAVATGAVTALLFATKETAPLVLLALGSAAVGLHATRNRENPARSSIVTKVGMALRASPLLAWETNAIRKGTHPSRRSPVIRRYPSRQARD